MKTEWLFDLNGTVAGRLFRSVDYPWEAMDSLFEYIMRVGRGLNKREFKELKRGVWVAESAFVSESAVLLAPIIIDEGAEVRNCSVIEGSIIGKGVVIGNFSEIRRSVFFDFSTAPMHNYISDSVIGMSVRLGMGAIASSIRADRGEVICESKRGKINTGKNRFGVLVGDGAEIGQSAVLSAGCVVEKGATVNPLTRARGFVSASQRYKGERIIYDLL